MYPHFRHYFFEHNSNTATNISSSFWGAFLGAFLAFLFGLLTFYITKRREGYIKHKNGLVKLSQLLHEHSDEIYMAKQNADETKKIVELKQLTDYRFILFKTPTDILMELQSIEIMNMYFKYSRMMSRANGNMTAKNHALTRFEDGMISGRNLAPESWDYIASSLGEIRDGLDVLDRENLNLIVHTRIYLNKLKDNWYVLEHMFTKKWDLVITDEQIACELKKITQENIGLKKEEKERNEMLDNFLKQKI